MQAIDPIDMALLEYRRASIFAGIDMLLKKAKFVDHIRPNQREILEFAAQTSN